MSRTLLVLVAPFLFACAVTALGLFLPVPVVEYVLVPGTVVGAWLYPGRVHDAPFVIVSLSVNFLLYVALGYLIIGLLRSGDRKKAN